MIRYNAGNGIYAAVVNSVVGFLHSADLTVSLCKIDPERAVEHVVVRILEVVSGGIFSLATVLKHRTGRFPLEAVGKCYIAKLNTRSPYSVKSEAELDLGVRLADNEVNADTAEVSLILDNECLKIGTGIALRGVTNHLNVRIRAVLDNVADAVFDALGVSKGSHGYVYLKLTLKDIGYGYKLSYLLVIAILGYKYCPRANTAHIVNYDIGILPYPLTHTDRGKGKSGYLITVNGGAVQCRLLRCKLSLLYGKIAVHYGRVHVSVSDGGGDLNHACHRSELGHVKSNTEKRYVLKALNRIGKLGNGVTVGYACARNRDGHVRLRYGELTCIFTLVIFIFNFQTEAIFACVNRGRAYSHDAYVLAERVGREMLFSIVSKAVKDIRKLKHPLLYVHVDGRALSHRTVGKNESDTEFISSRVTYGSSRRLQEFPRAKLVRGELNVTESITVGCGEIGERGIIDLLENCVYDFIAVELIGGEIKIPSDELVAGLNSYLGCYKLTRG